MSLNLKTTILETTVRAGCGLVYGKLAHVSPILSAKILAVSGLANKILSSIVYAICDNGSKKRRILMDCSCDLVADIACVIAMRRFNLIGGVGTWIGGSTIALSSLLYLYDFVSLSTSSKKTSY